VAAFSLISSAASRARDAAYMVAGKINIKDSIPLALGMRRILIGLKFFKRSSRVELKPLFNLRRIYGRKHDKICDLS
jgi:hypothetical protein